MPIAGLQSCDRVPGEPGPFAGAFSKIDANRDQCQSREEDDWKNPEDNDPDIGIIDVSPDLMRKYEQK